MAVQLDVSDGILWMRLEGNVDAAMFEDLLVRVRAVEGAGEWITNRIGDLRGVTGFSIQFSEFNRLIAPRRDELLPSPIRTALIAPEPLQVGMARMFSLLNTNPQTSIGVFPDEAAARRWLNDG